MVSMSKLVDAKIAELGDWRGQMIAAIRAVVHTVNPEVTEDIKWKGAVVWTHGGIVCAVDTQAKDSVKVIFLKGAQLPDPTKLFNAELEGNARRAIKYYEGDDIREDDLKQLIRASIDLNLGKA